MPEPKRFIEALGGLYEGTEEKLGQLSALGGVGLAASMSAPHMIVGGLKYGIPRAYETWRAQPGLGERIAAETQAGGSMGSALAKYGLGALASVGEGMEYGARRLPGGGALMQGYEEAIAAAERKGVSPWLTTGVDMLAPGPDLAMMRLFHGTPHLWKAEKLTQFEARLPGGEVIQFTSRDPERAAEWARRRLGNDAEITQVGIVEVPKPDIKRIGTGEAQGAPHLAGEYSPGHYLAEEREVGEFYQRSVTELHRSRQPGATYNEYLYKGKPIDEWKYDLIPDDEGAWLQHPSQYYAHGHTDLETAAEIEAVNQMEKVDFDTGDAGRNLQARHAELSEDIRILEAQIAPYQMALKEGKGVGELLENHVRNELEKIAYHKRRLEVFESAFHKIGEFEPHDFVKRVVSPEDTPIAPHLVEVAADVEPQHLMPWRTKMQMDDPTVKRLKEIPELEGFWQNERLTDYKGSTVRGAISDLHGKTRVSGEQVYRWLEAKLGAEEAQNVFGQHGFFGVIYRDAESRHVSPQLRIGDDYIDLGNTKTIPESMINEEIVRSVRAGADGPTDEYVERVAENELINYAKGAVNYKGPLGVMEQAKAGVEARLRHIDELPQEARVVDSFRENARNFWSRVRATLEEVDTNWGVEVLESGPSDKITRNVVLWTDEPIEVLAVDDSEIRGALAQQRRQLLIGGGLEEGGTKGGLAQPGIE